MDPKEILQDPEAIKNLITLLQTLLPSENDSKNKTKTKKQNSKTKAPTKKNTNIKTRNKRSVVANNINKFEKMHEFSMHKDDSIIDQKLFKQPPVARNRDFEPMDVTCRICGKKESVSPSLVYEGPLRYKCNNCSTQAG